VASLQVAPQLCLAVEQCWHPVSPQKKARVKAEGEDDDDPKKRFRGAQPLAKPPGSHDHGAGEHAAELKSTQVIALST
jgi:hypothetical protein